MEPVTIALDAMGGDDAPQIVVAGANIARRRYPHVNFLLYGDEQQISKLISKQRGLRDYVEIYHTSEQVADDDKETRLHSNLKRKPLGVSTHTGDKVVDELQREIIRMVDSLER